MMLLVPKVDEKELFDKLSRFLFISSEQLRHAQESELLAQGLPLCHLNFGVAPCFMSDSFTIARVQEGPMQPIPNPPGRSPSMEA